MSAAQHTPGPWMVLPSVTPTQFAILTENGPRKDIACTYGFEGDPREANARLIAAAPDLLAVAEHCRDLLMRYEINRIDGEELSDAALKKLNAAIAKAEVQS